MVQENIIIKVLVNNILTPQEIVARSPIPHFLHQRKKSQRICSLIPQGHPHHIIT